ncbi:MAG: hypothetical protein ABJH08_01085 [Balneola sp.]
MNKENLDRILEEYKAQPVGSGYIDIIVKRENYRTFVQSLIENGFKIRSISWWEWCNQEKECEYGLGGPESDYYNGWFAEIPIDKDDLSFDGLNNKEMIEKTLDFIDNKSIKFSDEMVKFKNSDWLLPALWLKVPEEW